MAILNFTTFQCQLNPQESAARTTTATTFESCTTSSTSDEDHNESPQEIKLYLYGKYIEDFKVCSLTLIAKHLI